MNGDPSQPIGSRLPASGLVVQGLTGEWFGWDYRIGTDGNLAPHLVSQDGTVALDLQQVARFDGVPLPGGFSREQFRLHDTAASPSGVTNEWHKQDGAVSAVDTVDVPTMPSQPSESTQAVEHEQTTTVMPKRHFHRGSVARLALSKIGVAGRPARSEEPKSPNEWNFYEGWGVATASFIRGDVEARGKIGKLLLAGAIRRSKGLRKVFVSLSRLSPVLVPAQVVTPIPGDGAITTAIVVGTGLAIAKRRKAMMSGEI